jgi:hypothetical protein
VARFVQLVPVWQRVLIVCAVLLLIGSVVTHTWLTGVAMAFVLLGQALDVRARVRRSAPEPDER